MIPAQAAAAPRSTVNHVQRPDGFLRPAVALKPPVSALDRIEAIFAQSQQPAEALPGDVLSKVAVSGVVEGVDQGERPVDEGSVFLPESGEGFKTKENYLVNMRIYASSFGDARKPLFMTTLNSCYGGRHPARQGEENG
jgi:hypothetical protein